VVAAAKGAGIPVSMCGEMAGDPLYAIVLLALGFDELSMNAAQIPTVKALLRRADRSEALQLFETAKKFTTAEEIERFVRAEVERRYAAPE
jgi:phosphotransferase system enzyme I (PtsI)